VEPDDQREQISEPDARLLAIALSHDFSKSLPRGPRRSELIKIIIRERAIAVELGKNDSVVVAQLGSIICNNFCNGQSKQKIAGILAEIGTPIAIDELFKIGIIDLIDIGIFAIEKLIDNTDIPKEDVLSGARRFVRTYDSESKLLCLVVACQRKADINTMRVVIQSCLSSPFPDARLFAIKTAARNPELCTGAIADYILRLSNCPDKEVRVAAKEAITRNKLEPDKPKVTSSIKPRDAFFSDFSFPPRAQQQKQPSPVPLCLIAANRQVLPRSTLHAR